MLLMILFFSSLLFFSLFFLFLSLFLSLFSPNLSRYIFIFSLLSILLFSLFSLLPRTATSSTISIKKNIILKYSATPKERPYTCSYCGKSFTQSNTLKQHTRIHTGEKPFRCGYCGRAFTVKDYLNKHLTTHTGEKQYIFQIKSISQSVNQLSTQLDSQLDSQSTNQSIDQSTQLVQVQKKKHNMIVTKNKKKQQKNLLYCKMPFILICHTLNNNNSLKNMAKREEHTDTRAQTRTHIEHAAREEKKAPPRDREREALDLKMYSFDQCLHRGSLKFIKTFLLSFFCQISHAYTQKFLNFLSFSSKLFFFYFCHSLLSKLKTSTKLKHKGNERKNF